MRDEARPPLAPRPEPAVKCQECEGEIALSSGWGPVGIKQFLCPHCGAVSQLTSMR